MTTQNQVQAHYPYMFSGKHLGISIARGWIEIFAKLCNDIDELLGSDKRGFHWRQCKEKFGSARWYWTMNEITPSLNVDLISPDRVSSYATVAKSCKPQDAALTSQLSELIAAAVLKTTSSCAACGKQGKNDRGDGWYLVLCPEQTQLRAENLLPSIWFEEDDE